MNYTYLVQVGQKIKYYYIKQNTIIGWDLNTGKSLYGSPLGLQKTVHTLIYFRNSDERLIAILEDGIQIITVDKANKKVLKLKILD